jgi:ribosomal protein S18 acetylase RimI-like enzyme
MLEIKYIDKEKDFPQDITKKKFIIFLYEHLGRFGDSIKAITKSVDYAFSTELGKGGFLLAAYYDNELAGELIMNNTGMEEYIPENILVYIAVNKKFRNKGIGKQIVEKSLEVSNGNVALHVEYDNPAKRLYERIGFTSKYAEMRLTKE